MSYTAILPRPHLQPPYCDFCYFRCFRCVARYVLSLKCICLQTVYLEQSTDGYSLVDNTETITKTTKDVSFLLGLRNMTVYALS